jgi:FKBP-type peptidyl-prolyl cis-trans isomerase
VRRRCDRRADFANFPTSVAIVACGDVSVSTVTVRHDPSLPCGLPTATIAVCPGSAGFPQEWYPMNVVLRSAVLMALVAGTSSLYAAQPAAKPAAASVPADKQHVSIMIGMDIAKSLQPIKGEVDIAVLSQAVQAAFAGKPTGLTEAQAEQVRAAFTQKMQAQMAARQNVEGQQNLADGQKFLAANKSKPGVRTTASGLQYQVIRPGSGPTPKPTDTVRVKYKGTLLSGKEFDSTDAHGGQPAEFVLNQVIPGWTEGVALMPVGSKYKFWIPSNLAYGPTGQAPIGPNSTLVFEVELLAIVK